MKQPADQAVYRMRKFNRREAMKKGYRHSLELIDEHNRQIMAATDIVGRTSSATLMITDDGGRGWEMNPNRRIMPSRWIVTDPEDRVVMQFDQQVIQKLANPLFKVGLCLLDGDGREVCRLVDPKANTAGHILGLGPREWAFLKGDKLVAKLVWLPRAKEEGKGLFARVRRFLTPSDHGIVSIGRDHLLAAPVTLGMLAIFEELTSRSTD